MPPIRSYVRRQGHMMPAQKRALENLWRQYGNTADSILDVQTLFGRQTSLYVEIGFGMGGALLDMAKNHPENDYLGVEVHLPGVGQLLLRINEMRLTNVRVDRRDIIEVLEYLPNQSLAGIYLFFPDPWPKKRHHKRRLVQSSFVEKMKRVLKPGGFFHAVTDWEDYARHMQKVFENSDGFVNRAGSSNFHPRPVDRPLTKFENRGLQKGNIVRDLLYDRI